METNSATASTPPISFSQQDEDSVSDDVSISSDQTGSVPSEKLLTTKEEPVVQNESQLVKRSKIFVYLAIAIAAATVGTLTYFLTAQNEATTFQVEFKGYALEVIDETERNFEEMTEQLRSLSHVLTSFSKALNQTWPYVTLPDFVLHGGDATQLTLTEWIVFAPVVNTSSKSDWEAYAWSHQTWIEESLTTAEEAEELDPGLISPQIYAWTREVTNNQSRDASRLEEEFEVVDSIAVPVWQMAPIPLYASIVNLDLITIPELKGVIGEVILNKHSILSGVLDLSVMNSATAYAVDVSEEEAESEHDHGRRATELLADATGPESVLVQPVFDCFLNSSNVKGLLFGKVTWKSFFEDVLPDRKHGVIVEVANACGANFTYQLNGPESIFLGHASRHDANYEDLKLTFSFAHDEEDDSNCYHTVSVYPSAELEATYHTNTPAVYTSIVVLVFFFTAFTFVAYDCVVDRRQKKLQASANRTAAIVSSMFPKDVQKRLLAEEEAKAEMEQRKRGRFGVKVQGQDDVFEKEGDSAQAYSLYKPNADFFPEVTIMFADIVGFTAWSSTREPSQVFSLLETIFNEYDLLAARRRVFKVETVGDCYVAVTGLPEPRQDHAVVMARFARDCLYKFSIVMKQLEVSLGPDTSDLGMRFGLHSGPVTAGVLRGDRSRFQLFGDTMNTCARIESTGQRNKIHLSQETADCLSAHGKGHWCRSRDDKVVAKGKGELTTFWLHMKGDLTHSTKSSSSDDTEGAEPQDSTEQSLLDPPKGAKLQSLNEKKLCLVRWNTEALAKVLRELMAQREASDVKPTPATFMRALERKQQDRQVMSLEEVQEVITLPKFDSEVAKKQRDATTITLGSDVMEQLQDYLQTIAALYRDNAFHNFEHASHVTMSVIKLLSRIVAPSHLSKTGAEDSSKNRHDHTYGITSDPLTQLAVILSALIHDVDHTGVPNMQLVKEEASIAAVYQNKSVAEQNSIDIAWDLLMQDQYEDLRRVIYSTEDEFHRFRQLLVNVVMATDIMDEELGAARKARWNVAFAESSTEQTDETMGNRKATIVLEHIIQASDVAHTMQHWQVYRKWNARFFEESYTAFVNGRAEKNPADSWYEGEIGFFDFYIIPLAKKLKDCGVFGVSSDEYLNYAQQNRREWESNGREVVAEMVERLRGGNLMEL